MISRLFRLKDAGSRAAAKEPEASLLQADPHLKDLASVPAGSLIVAPQNSLTPSTRWRWQR